MIAMVAPHPDQIRYFAESALNGFSTLTPATAIANAKDDLSGLLLYLEQLENHAVPILGKVRVEPWIALEVVASEPERDDLANFKSGGAGFAVAV